MRKRRRSWSGGLGVREMQSEGGKRGTSVGQWQGAGETSSQVSSIEKWGLWQCQDLLFSLNIFVVNLRKQVKGLWFEQHLQLLGINLSPFYWFDRKGLAAGPVSRPVLPSLLVEKHCPVLQLLLRGLAPQKGVQTVTSEIAQQCEPKSGRWRNLGDFLPKSTSTPKENALTGWICLASHSDTKAVSKLLAQSAPQLLGRCHWIGQFGFFTHYNYFCLLFATCDNPKDGAGSRTQFETLPHCWF